MPNSSVDLHLHTYYSDGRGSPAEILHYAEQIGLKVVSITDHDTLQGAREAANVAASLGVELVPGIELTASWETGPPQANGSPSQDVDLLGYFFQPQNPGLAGFVQAAFDDFRVRMVDLCQLLTTAGYPLTIYDILDENSRYPGPRQAISALWHKGYVGSWNEAYSLFQAQWPSVRPSRFPIDQATAALHAAGGIAVLAHPVAVNCGGGWLQEGQLAPLVEMGLDGLEIYHPRLDSPARAHFKALAERFDLVVTGGSDEHGWSGGFARMGSELVTYEMVEIAQHRAQKYFQTTER